MCNAAPRREPALVRSVASHVAPWPVRPREPSMPRAASGQPDPRPVGPQTGHRTRRQTPADAREQSERKLYFCHNIMHVCKVGLESHAVPTASMGERREPRTLESSNLSLYIQVIFDLIAGCRISRLGEAEAVGLRIALHEAHEAVPLVRGLEHDNALHEAGLAVRERRRHLRGLDRAL